MVYITVRQSPIYHQMTLEEYLFQNYQTPPVVNANIANTRTYEVENVSEHFSSKIGVEALIGKLVRFNNDTAELRAKERSELYETFYIPKKSGGLRRIDAPKAELMDALRRLKTIFEDESLTCTTFLAAQHWIMPSQCSRWFFLLVRLLKSHRARQHCGQLCR